MQEAVLGIANNQPDMVLVDEVLPGGFAAVGHIRGVVPQIPVVVIAVSETAQEVIAWAEAGAAGYIPKTAGLAEIAPLLVDIMRDRQPCSASVVAGLLRRLRNGGTANSGHHDTNSQPALTPRETQIAQMIGAGMSNKDIARCLKIEPATAKTHVHHILGKLKLQRRGQAASWMRRHTDI